MQDEHLVRYAYGQFSLGDWEKLHRRDRVRERHRLAYLLRLTLVHEGKQIGVGPALLTACGHEQFPNLDRFHQLRQVARMSLIDRGQHDRIQPLQTIPAQPLAYLTRSVPIAAAVYEHRVFGVAQQNGLTAAARQIRHRIPAVLVLHLGNT